MPFYLETLKVQRSISDIRTNGPSKNMYSQTCVQRWTLGTQNVWPLLTRSRCSTESVICLQLFLGWILIVRPGYSQRRLNA